MKIPRDRLVVITGLANLLNMTVDEAVHFFEHIPLIKRKLDTWHDVELHYVKLGQSATTLSGGRGWAATAQTLARTVETSDWTDDVHFG